MMITHVAIKVGNRVWKLPPPDRHGHVIFKILFEKGRLPVHVQGFVNDKGEFLDRKEAWREAKRCKQILPPCNPIDPSQRIGTVEDVPGIERDDKDLFSEDLW